MPRLIKFHRCPEGMEILSAIAEPWREQAAYYHALGDGQKCLGQVDEARTSWTHAMALNPAYPREQHYELVDQWSVELRAPVGRIGAQVWA